ncbi:MAG: glucose dehydrogenase [Planctomycetaceae bacterium]|nr:glucose dehydrogenase [Planctomycetaceae bacterium]
MKYTNRLTAVGLVAALALLTLSSAGAAEHNQLSQQEKKAGWKLLFDGKTTSGWRNYKKETVGKGWKVEDGVLTRAGGGAGDIITAEQYDAFEFSLEYRISKGGNSGLMFHVVEGDGPSYRTGPEIQIQDNVDGHDPQKAGWLYQLYSSEVDATKPAGEWNELRIQIAPQQSVIYMNGIRYARFAKGSKDWKKRVAKSKFAKWEGFGEAEKGHICLQDHGNLVSFRNIKVREIPKDGSLGDIADRTLGIKAAVAFPDLKWSGWTGETAKGKVQALRPIVLKHAGDGSNRVFVATQRGVFHVFDNDQAAKKTKVFLDLSDRVHYFDKQNEEGLLGFAFHPDYKSNGELFVFYTTQEAPQTTVISRFRVSKDDPNRALADSEEEIMRIKQPYWNHNGGDLVFGPDGYLYLTQGDGGAGDDPHENGQNLGTLLGSILRIDIDRKDPGKAYAIPKDNPFVGQEGKRGEIWAYGLRNVWRMAFDPKTDKLWAADVGQNLWEEINIIEKGGNYGWNVREGAHMFGAKGREAGKGLIDPIFEYDHDVGKSITGGFVYRGKKFPYLVGSYIFADYVTGRIWALRYDEANKKVVEVGAIKGNELPVLSFGEDQDGEVYFMIVTLNGQGIYHLEADK